MSNIENFFEFGDFMVEFGSDYLGCGKVSICLKPSFREIRRDALQPPQAKQIKAVNLTISAILGNAERFWQSLGGCRKNVFNGSIFRNGASLQLYPADPVRSGYEFKRIYIENIEQLSGSELAAGSLKITFAGELPINGDNYFDFITPGKRPSGAEKFRDVPDLDTINRGLVKLLAEKLDAVPGQDISLNFFAPPPRGSYALTLEKCLSWGSSTAHCFDFKLTARFPVIEKTCIDHKLYTLAQFLHDYRLDLGDCNAWACEVKQVDFSAQKSVAGNSVTDSFIRFSLLF